MNSPPSKFDAVAGDGFELLHDTIKSWVWSKGWTALRDAQEKAIRPILSGERDVIIAAATASGKTEAAFLPILTKIANSGEDSALAIYISPLKALINDQWGRLEQLCEELEVPVTPWHGDITATRKQKFLKYPRGVLLITPESLEALFVRRGSTVRHIFGEVIYIVIDELHAFIGSDRGKQMQSLLYRIEAAAGRRIPRVGLSATLGDMDAAKRYLRNELGAVDLVQSGAADQQLGVQVRGYITPAYIDEQPEQLPVAQEAVADHLYKTLLGTNNLVFPNSRSKVEFYTDALRRRCENDGRPVEFWPHHGSLSKDIREETERALKDGSQAATAICTNTLELGIDIGAVKSVAQIGPGPSVASLRQRLGRSGRRAGERAVLRSYAIEDQLTSKSSTSDRLREGLIQSVAMINLLIKGWFEPPNAAGLHFSTLVQQALSMIAERGGATAKQLYQWLVVEGAFSGLSVAEFTEMLRSLAAKELVSQDPTGLLLLGQDGERRVASFEFFAAFASGDEWRIENNGRRMGSLPITSPVFVGLRIIFGGRRWSITSIDEQASVIVVAADQGGKPPMFDGGSTNVHGVVRKEMRRVLQGSEPIAYLDETAQRLLAEARTHYQNLQLETKQVLTIGTSKELLTWSGDDSNDALVVLLRSLGVGDIGNEGLIVAIGKCDNDSLVDKLSDIAELDDKDLSSMLTDVHNMQRGKWDWALSDSLLKKSFASQFLSLEGARCSARDLVKSL
jgi:ATP-dependent Lhr-like helicase